MVRYRKKGGRGMNWSVKLLDTIQLFRQQVHSLTKDYLR